MKLKLVVAMSVLGLISCSAFADTTTTTQTKQKTHKAKMKHHMVSRGYKDEGTLPMQPVVAETCPINNWYTSIMDEMNQAMGRAKPTVGCHNPIALSGGMNFDVHSGNLSQGYMGENVERFSLNDAYLNADANVNDWTKAFASLSYNNASGAGTTTDASTNGVRSLNERGRYAADTLYPTDRVNLEQGYIQFGNMDCAVYPIFLQLGKQFQNYGRYEIHPLVRTMVQSLTETLRTSAELGFVSRMGLNGSIAMFDNPINKTTNSHSDFNYLAALGFNQVTGDNLAYRLGIGYMNDMTGVNDVAYDVATVNGTNSYVHKVAAWEAYAGLGTGPFSVDLDYTTAIQRFSNLDLPTTLVGTTVGPNGAKPWAAGVKLGYGFNAMNKDQKIALGYQTSNQTVAMNLPRHRWTAAYGVDMWKNVNLGLEVDHDVAYSASTGGTGNNSNTINFRVATMFG